MCNMKKLISLVLAIMMIGLVGLAFADGPAEKSITINGLAAGDNVKYYKVIEWNETNGWQFIAPFSSALSTDEQAEVIGHVDTSTTPATVVTGTITDTTAQKMASAVTSSVAPIVAGGDTLTSTSWTKTNQDPGLYLALITAAAPAAAESEMVIYNPAFVAVQADNAGSAITLPLNYADTGTAKKSTITLDKKAKSQGASEWVDVTTEDVGDIIDFKVETTVPAYLESWTNPVFTLIDTLSSGLTLAVGSNGALSDVNVSGATTGAMTANNQYTIAKTATGYIITFSDSYLKGRVAAEVVTVTYQAKITAEAKNVNPETNTVTIEYSRNPSDSSDHGTKEDKTTHYTFSIDAGLFGDENYETSELVKVGRDAAGNPITEEKTYNNGSKHNPLQGAQFALYTDSACNTRYTNSTITATTVFTTDANGKLNITGLDEGTYYLKEVVPATGYMLLTDIVSYTITASYRDVPATATCNAYKELSGYTVSVNGGATSTYTFENGAITKTGTAAGDQSTEITNTQGTSLPSTGGIGTTVFYVLGGLLVVGAAVILVARRKADN